MESATRSMRTFLVGGLAVLAGCGEETCAGRQVIFYNAEDGALLRATMPGGLGDAEDLGVDDEVIAVAPGGDLAVAASWLVGGDRPVAIPGDFAGFDVAGGRILGTGRSRGVFVMDHAGATRMIYEELGAPRSVAAGRVALSTIVLGAGGSVEAVGVRALDLDTGDVLYDRTLAGTAVPYPVLSADGAWLAFRDGSWDAPVVLVVRLDDGAEIRRPGCEAVEADGTASEWLLSGGERFPGAPFSPGSDAILLHCGGDLVRVALADGNEAVLAASRGLARYLGDGSLVYLVRGTEPVPDGTLVFDDIWVIPPGGDPEERVADRRGRLIEGASLDGRYVLFKSFEEVTSGDVVLISDGARRRPGPDVRRRLRVGQSNRPLPPAELRRKDGCALGRLVSRRRMRT